MAGKKDNSTFDRKLALHRRAVSALGCVPVVLETHGGYGRIGERCLDGAIGVVIERDSRKADHLALRRPDWRIYCGDCVAALTEGLASETAFNLISCDPWGSPFPVLEAIFHRPRQLARTVELVVNDGLRQKVKTGSAWTVHALRSQVERHGNDIYPIYLDVAREKLGEIVAVAGYSVVGFRGYYCGHNHDMTHYWATLRIGE